MKNPFKSTRTHSETGITVRSSMDDTESTDAFDETNVSGKVADQQLSVKVDPFSGNEVKESTNRVQCASFTEWAKVFAMAAVMGLTFGAAFSKARVFEPMVVRGQLLFKSFIMLKMFMSAVGTSTLCFVIINKTSVKPRFKESREKRCTSRGLGTTVIGAFILGIGLALAGACPSMVPSQVGAATTHSGYTIIGAIVGALFFEFTDPIIKPVMNRFCGPKLKLEYLDQFLGISYTICGLMLVCCAFAAAVLFEVFFPWEEELYRPLEDDCSLKHFWNCYAWPPAIAGVMVGILQIPVFLLMSNTLGSSTAYVAVCSAWVYLLPANWRRPFDYARRFAFPTPDTHWQLFFVLFAMLGCFLTELRHGMLGTAESLSIAYSIVGGFLFIFGARMAGGCTAGHGVSGMALLSIHSIAAVAAMFGGGIATSYLIFAGITESFYIAPTGYVH